eukprot:5289995-Prymnesium_polylepis.1
MCRAAAASCGTISRDTTAAAPLRRNTGWWEAAVRRDEKDGVNEEVPRGAEVYTVRWAAACVRGVPPPYARAAIIASKPEPEPMSSTRGGRPEWTRAPTAARNARSKQPLRPSSAIIGKLLHGAGVVAISDHREAVAWRGGRCNQRSSGSYIARGYGQRSLDPYHMNPTAT